MFYLGRNNRGKFMKNGIYIFDYFGFCLISYNQETKDWHCSLAIKFFINNEITNFGSLHTKGGRNRVRGLYDFNNLLIVGFYCSHVLN